MNMDRTSVTVLEQGQTLYYPIPTGDALSLQLAKRAGTLKGLKIGFLGNLKPNCDVLLHTTEEEVMKLGAASTFFIEKASCSLGAGASILDDIAATCQVAVVALGD